ncbi:hypothetical protein A9W95_01470 [Mycobacterium sp. 1423905.2]|nr:hypothetical protein A9W95_01470 [Mycobacterium sp. 1423905.2]
MALVERVNHVRDVNYHQLPAHWLTGLHSADQLRGAGDLITRNAVDDAHLECVSRRHRGRLLATITAAHTILLSLGTRS